MTDDHGASARPTPAPRPAAAGGATAEPRRRDLADLLRAALGIVFVQMATGNDPVLGAAPPTAPGPSRKARAAPKSDAGRGSKRSRTREPGEEAIAEGVEPEVPEEVANPNPKPVITGQS